MSESLVSLRYEYPIAHIRIHREPNLNALNEGVLSGLSDSLRQIHEALEGPDGFSLARAVVISGEGEKAFVAGADIKLMQGASPLEFQRYVLLGQRVMRQIEELPLPVIARVQGFALGGGMELALACDFIVASEKAVFGQPEVNLGLLPGFGGSQRLAARIGRAKTKRLVYTGESLTAPDALAFGVIDYLVPHEKLDEKILELVQVYASKSPESLAAAKRAVDSFFSSALQAGLLAEMEEFLTISTTANAKEGLSAFVEKRKPKFTEK